MNDHDAIEAEAQAIIRDAMRYRSLISPRSVGNVDLVVMRRCWDRSEGDGEMLHLRVDGSGKDELDALIDEQIAKQEKLCESSQPTTTK